MAKEFKIEPSNQIKLLGCYLNKQLDYSTEISKLCSSISYKLNQLKKLTHITNFNSRLAFARAYLINKLQYSMPLYTNLTSKNIADLNRALMNIARYVHNDYCFMKRKSYILGQCGWDNIETMISKSVVIFTHKVISSKIPQPLFNLIRYRENQRGVSPLAPAYYPKTTRFKKNVLYKGLELINSIDPKFRVLHHRNFVVKVKTGKIPIGIT